MASSAQIVLRRGEWSERKNAVSMCEAFSKLKAGVSRHMKGWYSGEVGVAVSKVYIPRQRKKGGRPKGLMTG